MRKYMMSLLLIFAAICAMASGCGKEAGSEFVGTWKYAGVYDNNPYEMYYVIEKSKNGDTTYIVTRYRLGIDSAKQAFFGKDELITKVK
ncbi:hypothetical protein AAAV92_00945 [Selenomonas noxia]|uniref:hypothetical protein n=1 Tax=Selenomonas noxia TaxID=135083 RepID=UPI0032C01D1A